MNEGENIERERDLVSELLDGNHGALARVITRIENRTPGYRDLVSALHAHTGNADVIGITGSPGSGKSTLVNRMAKQYRERDLTVGIIGIDPSSPFTGGAVLGDRIRMASTTGDMDVFFRSMSARGSLGGLSMATADAVKALDAFGKDKVIVETVGAGQNEIDIVKTADTVCVLVPPGSGDDVQMLKAGILEIGDVFVVNKADLDGADRTVNELREMIEGRSDRLDTLDAHRDSTGSSANGTDDGTGDTTRERPTGRSTSEGDRATTVEEEGVSGVDSDSKAEHKSKAESESASESEPEPEPESESKAEPEPEPWTPRIVETIAKSGAGVEGFLEALRAHREHMDHTDRFERRRRRRYAEEIRALLREDSSALIEREVGARGGLDAFVDRVMAHETDPYAVADELTAPLRACLDERRDEDA